MRYFVVPRFLYTLAHYSVSAWPLTRDIDSWQREQILDISFELSGCYGEFTMECHFGSDSEVYTRTCYLCIMRSNSTDASAACLWETIQLPHDLRPLSTYVSIKQAPIRSRSRSILYDNIRAKWIFRTALAARSGAILSARWQSLPPTESFS